MYILRQNFCQCLNGIALYGIAPILLKFLATVVERWCTILSVRPHNAHLYTKRHFWRELIKPPLILHELPLLENIACLPSTSSDTWRTYMTPSFTLALMTIFEIWWVEIFSRNLSMQCGLNKCQIYPIRRGIFIINIALVILTSKFWPPW